MNTNNELETVRAMMKTGATFNVSVFEKLAMASFENWTAFAEWSGVTRNGTWHHRKGRKHPTAESIMAYADTLNVQPATLLKGVRSSLAEREASVAAREAAVAAREAAL